MLMAKRAALVALVAVGTMLLPPFASSQDVGHFDVALSGAGVFSKTTTGNGITNSPTKSGAYLLTGRFRANHLHSFAFNIGHTYNSQVYSVPPDTYRVKAGITEITGAYFLSPIQTEKTEVFIFGGGGQLRFSPGKTYIDGFEAGFPVSQRNPLAILYGVGADRKVWKALAVRLQYRGLAYKAPDFGVHNLTTGGRGNLSEVAVGIVVKF